MGLTAARAVRSPFSLIGSVASEPDHWQGRAYNNGNGFVLDAQSSGIRCGDNEDGDDIPAANVIAVQSGVDIVLSWTGTSLYLVCESNEHVNKYSPLIRVA